VSRDEFHGVPQAARFRDDALADCAEQVARPIPAAHLLSAELGRLRPGQVAPKRFLECYIEVVEPGLAQMIASEAGEHVLVALRVQDAVDDRMASVIKRTPRHTIDKRDVQSARPVRLLQDVTSDQILGNPRYSATVGLPECLGDSRLAGSGVAA